MSITIAIIVVLIIIIAVSYNVRDKDGVIGGAARTVVSLVQKPVSVLGDAISGALGDAFSDDALLKENERLKEKNEALEKELTLNRLNDTELKELRALYKVLNVSGIPDDRDIVAANIVSYEGSGSYDIFTVDVGSEAGVERNTVVISGEGLVGRVLDTGKGWSKIVATIDENNRVGLELRGPKTYLGICYGDGKGHLSGYLLDENAEAKEGQLVYTSGIGGIYPSGLIIGNVISSELSDASGLLSIQIRTVNDFKSLKKVGLLI